MFLKKSVQFSLISLVLTLMILCGPRPSLGAEKKTLTWGSTATTSGLFTYYVIAAKILNNRIPELNLTIRSTGGGVHNARLLEKQEIDIGSIATSTTWEAKEGKGVFKDKPFPDFRLFHAPAR